MFQRKNFAYGKVATAPSPAASGTSLTLESGQGARFPNTSGGTYVCVVKQANLPATPDIAEVVLVTSHDPANDNFTITRTQEGSDARTIEVGDEFYLSPTDGVWDQIDVLTTKGDLMGFDTAYARIPVGTDDYVLTADSTDDQGVTWKAIGAESKIIGEVPTGTVDGSNDDFELSEAPFSGTLQVYLNGVRQKITDDYTLSGTTITFVTPPLTGSSILCDFNQNVSPSGNADTLDGQHAPTGTIVGNSDTQTLTNKRINPRVVTAASYTTDTGTALDVSTCDEFDVTAQAGALKLNNPGGTPVNGQKLIVRIKDNGTARALTYDTQFRASSDLALPTTTVLSKTLYMGFIFNSADTKWDLLALLNNI